MKKKFEYSERRGLPGGPNETFSYTTGVFSTEGYKRYSPDVNNPFNIIPSGNITMKDVDFPVEGTDNLGNSIMMKPGYDYKFPGNMVFELPIKEEKNVKPYGSINTFGNMAVAAGGLKSKNLDIEARYAKLLEQLGESTGSFNFGVNAKANKNNYQFNINPNITLSGDKPRIGINAGIKKTFRKGGGLLTKNMKCNNCGWSWRGVDGGKDATTCHKCGGSVLPKAQKGRENIPTYLPEIGGYKVPVDLESGNIKGGILPEVTVSGKATPLVRHKKAYETNNPYDAQQYATDLFNNPKSREEYFDRFNKDRFFQKYGQRGYNEFQDNAWKFAAEQRMSQLPQGNRSRVEYLNDLTAKEEELFKKYNPALQTTYSTDFLRAVNAKERESYDQLKDKLYNGPEKDLYTEREKQNMLQNYKYIGGVHGGDALAPLTWMSKPIQSIYKDDYSGYDALVGRKNDATIVEDIFTDPTLIYGLGKTAFNLGAKGLKQIGKHLSLNQADDLVDLYRIQEKSGKTFAQLAAENKIPKAFNTPKVLAQKANEEKYFGQWFTKDKADLDWYMKDREFVDPEIIHLKVPKSQLQKYTNYDKSLSRAPDREFVIPINEQSLYKQPNTSNAASSIEPIYRGVYINDEIRNLPKFKGKTDDEILDIMGTRIPGNTGTRRKKQLQQTLNFGKDYESALEHIGKHTDESSIQRLGNTSDLKSGKMYVLKVQPDDLPFMSAEQQNMLYKQTIDAWKKNNPNAGFILGNDAKNLNPELLRQFGESPVFRSEGVNVIDGNFPQFIGIEDTKIGKLLESKEVTRQDYLDYLSNLKANSEPPSESIKMIFKPMNKYQAGGSLPKAQFGIPTTADSIALYNNAIQKGKFYKNNPDYTEAPSAWTDNSDISYIFDQLVKNKDYYNNEADMLYYRDNRYGSPEPRFNVINQNMIELGDILDGEPNYVYNNAAPSILLHNIIEPTKWVQYVTKSKDDRSDIPYYDPVTIYPKSLGPVPREAYRYSDIPYVKTTSNNTTSSSKSTSQNKTTPVNTTPSALGTIRPFIEKEYIETKKATPIDNKILPYVILNPFEGESVYVRERQPQEKGSALYDAEGKKYQLLDYFDKKTNKKVGTWDPIKNQIVKEYQNGGQLPKAQKGKTIYTSDLNDPRLLSYKDSSALYDYSQLQHQLEDGYVTLFPSKQQREKQSAGQFELQKAAADLVKNNPNISWMNDRIAGPKYMYQGQEVIPGSAMFNEIGIENLEIVPNRDNSPDLSHITIKPTGTWMGKGQNFDYPKPKTKVVYKPETRPTSTRDKKSSSAKTIQNKYYYNNNPKIPLDYLERKEYVTLQNNPNMKKVPEEKVPYKKEPAWYQRTGFNSQPIRIQPSNYDPDAPYWRGEPYQKEYQDGGKVSKGETRRTAPTYMLDEVTVEAFPNATPAQKAALSTGAGNPIYRNAKSQLMNNKRPGNIYKDYHNFQGALPFFEFAAEMSGVPGAVRTYNKVKEEGPVPLLKDVGKTLESIILDSTPFSNTIPSPNQDWSGLSSTSDAIDAIPFIGATAGGIKRGASAGLRAFSKSFIPNLDDVGAQAFKPTLSSKPLSVSNKAASIDNVGSGLTNTPQPWQMQELPGLHLKSTMEGEAISKIVEPKTGMINIEQALAIIGKESGGADKVKLVREALGENIPKKMDFNEFRKVVQDQLIPLERQFATHSSNYGIQKLGYNNTSTFKRFAQMTEEEILQIEKAIAENPKITERDLDILKNYEDALEQAKIRLDYYKGNMPQTSKTIPLENQTLILGNKFKFGKGSSAHGNPEETLGHIHFLRDVETPDVLTVTQIQSDAFQGTHRIMPSHNSEINEWKKILTPEGKKQLIEDGGEEAAELVQIAAKEFLEKAEKKATEALGPNPIQKQLLDKNHQERYLQELVDYAGKRGDVNKIRVPTSETAAKVQNYSKIELTGDNTPGFAELQEKISIAVRQGNQKEVDELMKIHDKMLNTPYKKYSNEHQTILKKYSQQPKTIKKLFGKEPTIVTDSKGNTWYEFDIPDKFKKGKGEIKAFGVAPLVGAGVTGVLGLQYFSNPQEQVEYRNGGQLPRAQDGLGLSNLYNKAKNLITESEELDYAKRLVNTLPQYLNPKTYSYSSEEGLDSIPNYNKYNNFGEAFKQAREDLGKGQTFLYNGKRYTTNKENEFPNDESETVFNTMTKTLSPEQKNKAKEYYFKQGAPYLSLEADDTKFTILPNAQVSFSDLSNRAHVNPVGPYNKVYLETMDYDFLPDEISEYEKSTGKTFYDQDVNLLIDELAHIEQVRDKGTGPFFKHFFFDGLKGELQKKSPYDMEGAIEHSAHEVIGPKRLKEIMGYQTGGQLLKVQDGNGEYTVQAGNTFDGIANLKGVPKDLLRKANPDIDYNNIKVGQVINIPDAPKTKEERMEFSSGRKREDLTENILSANKLENYLAESRGNTPEFWKATADTIAYHESGPWQRMDPKAIQRSQDKDTGEIFQGPGEGLFQIETDRAGGSNSFSTFKNRYANIAEALGLDADPEIMNAKRPIDLPAEKQYTLFYSNLIESPDVKLKDYVDGKLSLEDLWLKGHKIKETKGDRENFQESVQNARKKGIPFTQIGEETSDLEIYKNYINGLYDGTEMEAAAQRLYDKLNRVYYGKAKGLGMSVPNYIMTNIINRTN